MNLALITGASRSGSTFLGDLMRRAKNASAHHELIGGRDFFCISAYCPEHPFVRHEIRRGLAELRDGGAGNQVAVDVNSNLAFAVKALRDEAPEAKLFHLCRNGREVIASNWLRKMYSPQAKGVDIRPHTDGELDAWRGFDRFEKLAWQWNRIASELIEKKVPLIRLEDAVSDYGYLNDKLLQPAVIEFEREVWDARRNRRVNPSRIKLKDLIRGGAEALKWTPERERRFQDLCGATMAALGYK
jgi:hypothetical protein